MTIIRYQGRKASAEVPSSDFKQSRDWMQDFAIIRRQLWTSGSRGERKQAHVAYIHLVIQWDFIDSENSEDSSCLLRWFDKWARSSSNWFWSNASITESFGSLSLQNSMQLLSIHVSNASDSFFSMFISSLILTIRWYISANLSRWTSRHSFESPKAVVCNDSVMRSCNSKIYNNAT